MMTRLPLQKPILLFFLLFSSNYLVAQSSDSLYHYWIQFPADIQTDCARSIDTAVVTGQNFGCGLLAIGHTDERLNQADGGGCYKILRTHRVINWCEYNGQAAPTVVSRDWDGFNGTNPGRCDLPAPDGNDRPGDRDIFVYVKKDLRDTFPDTVYYDRDNNPYNTFPDNSETDDAEGFWWNVISGGDDPSEESYYEGNCSTWSYDENQSDADISGNISQDDLDQRYGSFGYWLYTQHITVYDQTPPEIIWDFPDTLYADSRADCSATLFESLLVSDSCALRAPDLQILLDLYDDGQDIIDVTFAWDGNAFGERYGLGTHRLTVIADDFCGNQTEEEHIFTVVDQQAPAPICHEDIGVELSLSEDLSIFATVSAYDLVASPIFDCSGQSDSLQGPNGNWLITDYSINRVGNPADRSSKILQVDCDDVDTIPVAVEIHAWDEAGNHDFCQTNVIVQDNRKRCTQGELIEIAGAIRTETGMPLENVEVQVSGGIDFITRTEADGSYVVPLFSNFRTIQLSPYAETDARSGISTIDLIRIQKHILGVEPFTSPYLLLASDLDNNARVNFIDLIRIRKMILGLETGEDMLSSWYFIPVDYQFTEPDRPWAENFPQSIELVTGINPNTIETDFIAVKIGDTNHSLFGDVETRSRKAVKLRLVDQDLEPDELTELKLRLSGEDQLEAAQFALQLDERAVELLSAEVTGVLSEVVSEVQGSRRLLKTVWIDDQSSDAVLHLRLRAKKATSLGEILQLDQRNLPGEAYLNNRVFPIELLFDQSLDSPELWIGANPFKEQTSLRFSSPISGDLRLFDQQGRQVWSTVLDQSTDVSIRKQELGPAGIYYFTLRSPEKEWSGKLICQ